MVIIKVTKRNKQQRQEKQASTMSILNPVEAVAMGIRAATGISLAVVSFGLEKAFHIGEEPKHAEFASEALNLYELADPMLDGTLLSNLACIVAPVGMKGCNR
jgi:hypothetical protein